MAGDSLAQETKMKRILLGAAYYVAPMPDQ
jgi:hypothetical protein